MRKVIFGAAFFVFVIAIVIIIADVVQDKEAAELSDRLLEVHNSPVSYDSEVIISMGTLSANTDDTVDSSLNNTNRVISSRDEADFLMVASDMFALCSENDDTAGWLKVSGTKINNVVVQCNNNDYYLNHDFEGNSSQPGTLFADFRCVVNDYADNQSDNIIIYGHRQKNGTMFGTLPNYHKNLNFYKENPTFEFTNRYETYVYKIVAIFNVKTEESWHSSSEVIFDYQNYVDFDDENYTFDKFKENILSLSEVKTSVDIEPDDKFITLSTCSYDFKGARFVVIGRRVREGESCDVDVSQAEVNKK